MQPEAPPTAGRARRRLFEVIFESDTPAGKAFDVALIGLILLSVLVVMLESVAAIRLRHGPLLRVAEWVFTALFTLEYALRLACHGRPGRYARSFYGLVDLAAVLPTYASVLVPGAQYLLVVRALRILRIFRVLKLAHFLAEMEVLVAALRASRRKIAVFLFVVLTLVLLLGSLMYLVEGGANGFTSIPRSVYWAIVTLTTVGYGDISPRTDLGQAIAACVMILGYGIIAVPSGIVTVELGRASSRRVSGRTCSECSAEGHDADARHCKHCGARL